MTDNRSTAKRAWLEGHLQWAADHFGVVVTGPPVHGPRIRSVGAKVTRGTQLLWLRVVFEDPEWGEGDYLGHALAANDILDVPKPRVVEWDDWDDNGRHLRGELLTYVADPVLSPGMLLGPTVELTDSWTTHLLLALSSLARHPLPTNGLDLTDVNNGALAYFGVTIDPTTVVWTTAHNDLHWGNLTAPTLTILDWETWGRAPAGYDAATLYLTGLRAPTSNRLRQALDPLLTGPDGRTAMIAAAVRLLRFVDGGEITEIATPLRHQITTVIENQSTGGTGPGD